MCGNDRGQDSIPGWYEESTRVSKDTVLFSQLQADRVGQRGHLHRYARELRPGIVDII